MTREAIAQLKARCEQALLDGQIVANAASKIAEISAQTGPVEPIGSAVGSTGHLLQVCEAALSGQTKAALPPPALAPVVVAPVVEAPIVEAAPAADESTEEAPKHSKKGRK